MRSGTCEGKVLPRRGTPVQAQLPMLPRKLLGCGKKTPARSVVRRSPDAADQRTDPLHLGCRRGLRLPRRRRSPPRRRCATGWPSTPTPTGRAAGRGRLRGPALARARGASTPTRSTRSSSTTSCGAAGVRRPSNPIGIGWAGPTILHAGTAGAEGPLPVPAAGGRGDLVPAVLRARRRLRPGQPRHPGGARRRRVGRQRPEDLDLAGPPLAGSASSSPAPTPTCAKHQGITYFICPMDAAGHRGPADHRDDRRAHVQRGLPRPTCGIPDENLVGDVERRLVAGQGHARQRAGVAVVRRGRCGAWARPPTTCSTWSGPRAASTTRCCATGWPSSTSSPRLLRLIRLRTVTARIRGEQPGPEASIRKILADEHGQRDHGAGQGPGRPGRHARPTPGRCGAPDLHGWHCGYLFAPALTIGGGTGRRAAQHPRRAGAGPAPRPRRRVGEVLVRGAPVGTVVTARELPAGAGHVPA